MLINQKFGLCRYYGGNQNVFADVVIYNKILTIIVEIVKSNAKSEVIKVYFDKENTGRLFNLVKIKDFKTRFSGIEGLKKLDQFIKENNIKTKIEKQYY